MKNMITMMIGIVIGAITILIILTVTGRMNYATELESQLPAVVENILCNVKIKQLYNVADNQEFTADVTEQIAKELDAGFIIAVDSLAARNTGRLNTTIQITDTGINPGSGVGNHRQAMNEETMGVPVIAIGVPTVVDAATIVNDVMDNLMAAFENAGMIRGLSDTMEEFSEKEKKQLVKELMDQKARDLYVTPKDIDEDIRILGEIIAQGINEAMDRYHAVA